MTRIRWACSILLLLCAWQEVRAQIIVSYPWWTGGQSFYSSGLGLNYFNRRLAVRGFLGNGVFVSSNPFYGSFYPPFPWGIVDNRITVSVTAAPAVTAVSSRRLQQLLDDINWQNDVTGVDLDVVGPEALERRPTQRPGKLRVPEKEPEPRKPERRKPEPVPEKVVPPEKVKEAKKDKERPKPPEVMPPKMPPDLPPPRLDPREESERLLRLGIEAFQNQFFGLAAFRFRQALKVEVLDGRPHFLLSQAEFALGAYRDAVATIKKGMNRQPNWPLMPYHKLELYRGIEADFADQLKRLETVLARDPKNSDLLFLLGHVRWFAGQRDQAVPLFRQARLTAADPAFIDAFLKAAGPGPLAAK